MNVLIIDSDTNMTLIIAALLATKYTDATIWRAHTGREARHLWGKEQPGLVIIDPILADCNGINLCRDMCADYEALVMAMSSCMDAQDEIAYLQASADDYLRKPFLPAQLLAHVEALGRRKKPVLSVTQSSVVLGPITVDGLRNLVRINEREIPLTPTECKLLYLLVSYEKQICTHELLVQHVWGTGYESKFDQHLIKAHIRHLREKLGDGYIIGIRGIGYQFSVVQKQESQP